MAPSRSLPPQTGTADFSLFMTNIARQQPDVILVPGYLTDVGKIIKQARLQGIKAPFLGPDSWDSPDLYTIVDKADLRGSYYMTHFSAQDPSPVVKEIVARFARKIKTVLRSHGNGLRRG